MNGSDQKGEGKKKDNEVQTFPVPFALGEIKTNITINTNSDSKPSKEQIINQAIKFHLKGNIAEAAKLYQYFINQGFKDHRVFSNYGNILKDLGKLEEAEFLYRKAIEITPDFAKAHSNLGNILIDLGKLEEAELSTRKAIELKPDFALARKNLKFIILLQNIKNGKWETSNKLLEELCNNYPRSQQENTNEFIKYWCFFCQRLIEKSDIKKLLPIFINLIIIGEMNEHVKNLVKNIFDRFSLNSILELVSEENKILLTLSYCEYKFSQQEFAEAETLASANIRKIESFIKNKHTENFGWLITKRTLKVFKNKGLARQNLQKLVQNLTN